MKAAILGAGFIAAFHAAGYAALPDTELCAICDADEARAKQLADTYHCAAYTDGLRMLEKEKPDLVSVCLPTFLHAQYVLAALNGGAHVLCEKPMALTLADCEAMADAARRNNRVLMIGQVLRWWPEYMEIARHIQRLGQPRYLRAQRLQYSARGGWFMQPQLGGGVLFDLLVHDLDYLCAVMHGVPRVLAASGRKGAEGSWRQLSVSLGWENGTYAHLETCNCMPKGYPFTASFHAEYEQAVLDYAFRAAVNLAQDEPAKTEFLLYEEGAVHSLPTDPFSQARAFQQEIAAFAAGAAAGVSPLPPEESIAVMGVVHSIKAALESPSA